MGMQVLMRMEKTYTLHSLHNQKIDCEQFAGCRKNNIYPWKIVINLELRRDCSNLTPQANWTYYENLKVASFEQRELYRNSINLKITQAERSSSVFETFDIIRTNIKDEDARDQDHSL